MNSDSLVQAPKQRAYLDGWRAGYAAGLRANMHRGLSPRGKLPDTILKMMPADDEWSSAKIKEAVRPQFPYSTDKQILSALAYLTRKRHLTRLGYGRYLRPAVTAAPEKRRVLSRTGEAP